MVILTKMLSFVTSNIRNKFCLQKLKFYTIKFNYYFHTSRILPNNRSAPSRAKKKSISCLKNFNNSKRHLPFSMFNSSGDHLDRNSTQQHRDPKPFAWEQNTQLSLSSSLRVNPFSLARNQNEPVLLSLARDLREANFTRSLADRFHQYCSERDLRRTHAILSCRAFAVFLLLFTIGWLKVKKKNILTFRDRSWQNSPESTLLWEGVLWRWEDFPFVEG